MPESFEKHFAQEREKEGRPLEQIKEERGLKLAKEIRELESKPDITEEDCERIIRLAEEIKGLYYEKRRFENGEVVCHYEGKCDGWVSHPEGVVIKKEINFF